MAEHVFSGTFILDCSNVIVPKDIVGSFAKIPITNVHVKTEANVITTIMTEPH